MGAILNLDKNWMNLAPMLQQSNDHIMIFFGHPELRLLSRIKLFEVL